MKIEVWRGRPDVPQTSGLGGVFLPPARFLLPHAPKDPAEWTQDHYWIYDLVELAVGNKRELTPAEIESRRAAEEVAKVADNAINDPDWLTKIDDLVDFDNVSFDDIPDHVIGSKQFGDAIDKGIEEDYSEE